MKTKMQLPAASSTFNFQLAEMTDKEYEKRALRESERWQRQMQRRPSLPSRLAKKMQDKTNSLIPEKVHIAFTAAIKQMTRTVLFGAKYTTARAVTNGSLQEREMRIRKRIDFYSKTAATEGAITGAGGFLLGLVDF